MHSVFKNFITKSKNLFDIYVYIYTILQQNLSDLKKSFEHDCDEDKDWVKKLSDLHEQKDFSININENYKKAILEILPNKDKYKLLCFLKLLFEKIDEIAGDKYYLTSKSYMQEDDGKKIRLTPLNTDSSLSIGEVF